MTKTNEHQLYQEFVEHYLHDIIRQLNECHVELITQSQSCLSTFLPLETLDNSLKEFVYLQRKYLSKIINDHLTRFKDVIHEKELLDKLSKYIRSVDQVYKHFQ